MAMFEVRYGALILLAATGVLAGCGTGSNNMTNATSPTTTASLSATSYDFGQNIVGNPDTQTVVEVTNTGTNPLTLNPTLVGPAGNFTVVAAQSCGATLAPASSCPIVVTYSSTIAGSQWTTLNLGLANVPMPTAPGLVTLTGTSAVMAAGTVTATANPQVALYTITPPFAGNVTVNFGPTTSYGKQTWSVATPSGGGTVSIEVAGMLANTAYHLQAAVTLADGVTATDVDHTFTTTSYSANLIPHFTATTTAGQTPQPGIEMLNPIIGPASELVATDLSGNIIWQYVPPDNINGATIYSPKQLSNGDILMLIAASGSTVLNHPPAPGTPNLVREVDLAGNTVKQITMTQLNASLAAANYNLTLQVFHHNVTALPNGHWLVLANTYKQFTNLPGYPGTINVLGDVVVDLDTNLNPVWAWNEFDHLDMNRHPTAFPDWTHTNDVIYSKDDGNILVSMRHQSWVVKVDYNNGAGTGNVIWHLGEGGDFTLAGGTDPTDWFYGQHGLSFTTPNTTGIFGLTLMDNGNFRLFPAGVTCGTGSAPPCLYSTIPVLQINETAMTATLETHQILPTNLYNFFGGNSEILPNGNLEYDLCGLQGAPNSQIFETPNQSTPQTVWNLKATGNYLYRGYRLPSLYPGVQW
ncbi:MAG: aryl-sulfate sulfotransferase [Acidobacteriaceae bacterium]